MSCSLSTHVLDTATGRPAAGVSVEVFVSGDGFERCLASGVTDADGRIASLADELAPGTYSLVFHPPSPFFTRVELQVELAEGHYHVPLVVSPYGCATYRGS
jgi:5-hydroxyisourate hydrolase